MTARKSKAEKGADEKEARVRARTDELMDGFTTMDAGSRMMTESIVRSFAWYEQTCADLMRQIDVEGALVDGEKGPRENPALAVLHKTSSRLHEFYSKVMTNTRKSQSDESSELMDFIDG